MQRFVALARALTVDHLAIIATAAVREARDGRAFAAEAERRCGVPVRIIDGGEEARLSAAGVLAGIRDADGVVADLGGGSVELVPIDAAAAMPIGAGVSLPIGPLRLTELGDRSRMAEFVERKIADAAVLGAAAGKSLYLVGGAWRALARLHMEQTQYPLHIIHEYAIPRQAAEPFLDIIAGQSRRSLDRIASISRKRLESLPVAALILRGLMAAGKPSRIVFSAFGLREGYAYGLLPGEPSGEPGRRRAARFLQGHRGEPEPMGRRWRPPLSLDRAALPRSSTAARRRLHRAACWLSDTAWSEHPDYRAGLAFARTLTLPFPQIGHGERVFVASALHARYGGQQRRPGKGADPRAARRGRPRPRRARSVSRCVLPIRCAAARCSSSTRSVSGATGAASRSNCRRPATCSPARP